MTASVYPTGTTVYAPEKCWNGYTLQSSAAQNVGLGAILVDMNGNVVNRWKGLNGFPSKMLPGGCVLSSTGERNPKYGFQDMVDLVQVDWEGNIVWRFNRYQRIKDPRRKPEWLARQHHDYQRDGNPVGYYVPGMEPRVNGGNTLLLCHKNVRNTAISEKPLQDDAIIEVTWEGKIVWEWLCSDHFDEMGFSEEAKNALARNPSLVKLPVGEVGDWMHMNSISRLGPNRWHAGGDARFHPDNIIWSGRNTNIVAIIDEQTGKIVWQVGPDYTATPALRKLGWIIGQHHAHLIPRGLPGEGNILLFDNGGQAGYGAPNPGAATGVGNARRDYSRVLEVDPLTLEVKWQYTPEETGKGGMMLGFRFYSHFISSAQRLPNGNTLITEGACGRLFEVTPEHEVVWEYVNPFQHPRMPINSIYRAYRVPYDWVPQVARPEEKAVPRPDNAGFRVPGSTLRKPLKVTAVKVSAVRGRNRRVEGR